LATSSDELSLTAAFTFSVGVAASLDINPPSAEVVDAADRAWTWLKARTVNGLSVSDTCAGQHLSTDEAFYNWNVGMNEGPGSALLPYAKLGAAALGFDLTVS